MVHFFSFKRQEMVVVPMFIYLVPIVLTQILEAREVSVPTHIPHLSGKCPYY